MQPSNAGQTGKSACCLNAVSWQARRFGRVAQGRFALRTQIIGWPSFWVLFLGQARKSTLRAFKEKKNKLKQSERVISTIVKFHTFGTFLVATRKVLASAAQQRAKNLFRKLENHQQL